MPVTRLDLVRHGAPQLTAGDRFPGPAAVDLADEGRRHAARLAERRRDERIGAVHDSPRARTLETARPIAGPGGLPIAPLTGGRPDSFRGGPARALTTSIPNIQCALPSRPGAATLPG
jgi:probable phosphoglycerate mutase